MVDALAVRHQSVPMQVCNVSSTVRACLISDTTGVLTVNMQFSSSTACITVTDVSLFELCCLTRGCQAVNIDLTTTINTLKKTLNGTNAESSTVLHLATNCYAVPCSRLIALPAHTHATSTLPVLVVNLTNANCFFKAAWQKHHSIALLM